MFKRSRRTTRQQQPYKQRTGCAYEVRRALEALRDAHDELREAQKIVRRDLRTDPDAKEAAVAINQSVSVIARQINVLSRIF